MITWDENKRQQNLKNHDLDFLGCESVFDYPVVGWDDDLDAYPMCRKTPFFRAGI